MILCTKQYFYLQAVHLSPQAVIQDFTAKLQFNFSNLIEFALGNLFKAMLCEASK